MTFTTTYICVDNMKKSLEFYSKLLETEPAFCSEH